MVVSAVTVPTSMNSTHGSLGTNHSLCSSSSYPNPDDHNDASGHYNCNSNSNMFHAYGSNETLMDTRSPAGSACQTYGSNSSSNNNRDDEDPNLQDPESLALPTTPMTSPARKRLNGLASSPTATRNPTTPAAPIAVEEGDFYIGLEDDPYTTEVSTTPTGSWSVPCTPSKVPQSPNDTMDEANEDDRYADTDMDQNTYHESASCHGLEVATPPSRSRKTTTTVSPVTHATIDSHLSTPTTTLSMTVRPCMDQRDGPIQNQGGEHVDMATTTTGTEKGDDNKIRTNSNSSNNKPFFIMDWLEEIPPQDLELACRMLKTPNVSCASDMNLIDVNNNDAAAAAAAAAAGQTNQVKDTEHDEDCKQQQQQQQDPLQTLWALMSQTFTPPRDKNKNDSKKSLSPIQKALFRDPPTCQDPSCEAAPPGTSASGTSSSSSTATANATTSTVAGSTCTFRERSIAIGNGWNAKGLQKARLGQWHKARLCWENALEIRQQVLGANHLDVANTHNNLGIAIATQIQENESQQQHRNSSNNNNNSNNKENRSTRSLKQHRKVEVSMKCAIDHLQRALAIRIKHYWQDSESTDNSAMSIGGTIDAMDTNTMMTTVIHPEVAATLYNIGNLYHQDGNYSEAIQYHTRAHCMFTQCLGRGHGQTARAYMALGHSHYEQRQFDQARTAYQKAHECYLEAGAEAANDPEVCQVEDYLQELNSLLLKQ